MKTIVFAYSEFGCIGIEELAKAGYVIAAVYTYRDDPQETVFYRSVAKICAEHDIPAYTIDKGEEAVRLQQMHDIAPDYIFSFYYRSLLSDEILSLAKKGAFNLHGSLLPKYRGRAPVNWVLVKGETETGVTLHYMVARVDAGDIVAQKKVPIAYEDTAFTLQRKLVNAARDLLKEQLPLIAQGKSQRMRQDITQGNYCGRRGPQDGIIQWQEPAETARNLIRAVTHPYPGAFTYFGDKKIFVWDSATQADTQGKAPGTILSTAPLTVACGTGALVIRGAQIGDGLYYSGKQLAQELKLQPGMQFKTV
jgi:UDP-4-amino-4-deoxy-L-arabinose formyltransferase/UDP-glucuronic acid dehydrogenase (UDP-4-keto-hexauronic acid decarboxylating)